jgi:hypothetical protein
VIKENNIQAGVFARAFEMAEAAQLPRLLLLTPMKYLPPKLTLPPLPCQSSSLTT